VAFKPWKEQTAFRSAPASWSAAKLRRFHSRTRLNKTEILRLHSDPPTILAMSSPETPWPHAPTHRLSENGAYFVTAATYQKAHHFRGRERVSVLHRGLLTVARDYGWQLEAWAVFSNHYHFVGNSPEPESGAESLETMLRVLHVKTARWVNRLDGTPNRQVWFNYRETKLTYQRSYLTRLNYVHQNAVKHGLVPEANQYPWCSAAWFENRAAIATVKRIYQIRIDSVAVTDDFEVAAEW